MRGNQYFVECYCTHTPTRSSAFNSKSLAAVDKRGHFPLLARFKIQLGKKQKESGTERERERLYMCFCIGFRFIHRLFFNRFTGVSDKQRRHLSMNFKWEKSNRKRSERVASRCERVANQDGSLLNQKRASFLHRSLWIEALNTTRKQASLSSETKYTETTAENRAVFFVLLYRKVKNELPFLS